VETLWEILSPDALRRKPIDSIQEPAASGEVGIFAPPGADGFLLTVNYIWASKMTHVIRLAIDSLEKRCTLSNPYRV
jgi:hypothetical protein